MICAMTTPRQASQVWLEWTVMKSVMPARRALSTVTLNMIENESVAPRTGTLDSIQRALEQGGVEFLDEQGQGVGVRFRRAA